MQPSKNSRFCRIVRISAEKAAADAPEGIHAPLGALNNAPPPTRLGACCSCQGSIAQHQEQGTWDLKILAIFANVHIGHDELLKHKKHAYLLKVSWLEVGAGEVVLALSL